MMNDEKGFRMTETDLGVIQKISETGVQSYANLTATVLKDYSRSQAWAIPGRLVKQGWLVECRGDRNIFLGWRLNTRGYQVRKWLNERFPTPVKRASIYKTSFEHDQLLDRVVTRLSEARVVKGFTPEHVLRREIGQRYWFMSELERREKCIAVSDAVLDLNVRGSKLKVGLELELSRKSKERIFKKIEHYLVHPDFKFTFYIIKGEPLMQLFQAIYRKTLETSLRVKFSGTKNGIYFSELENILVNGPDAKFIGLDNVISLNQLYEEGSKQNEIDVRFEKEQKSKGCDTTS